MLIRCAVSAMSFIRALCMYRSLLAIVVGHLARPVASANLRIAPMISGMAGGGARKGVVAARWDLGSGD